MSRETNSSKDGKKKSLSSLGGPSKKEESTGPGSGLRLSIKPKGSAGESTGANSPQKGAKAEKKAKASGGDSDGKKGGERKETKKGKGLVSVAPLPSSFMKKPQEEKNKPAQKVSLAKKPMAEGNAEEKKKASATPSQKSAEKKLASAKDGASASKKKDQKPKAEHLALNPVVFGQGVSQDAKTTKPAKHVSSREAKGDEAQEKESKKKERSTREKADKEKKRAKKGGDESAREAAVKSPRSSVDQAAEATRKAKEAAAKGGIDLQGRGGEREAKTGRKKKKGGSTFKEVTNATRSFGRYELLMQVSQGGMATLYLARMSGPEDFEKVLAIKKIHDHLSQEPEFIDMFLDEARIAARIQHPNVATIFDLGEVDESFFIAMEYIHGQNLREILREAARRKRRIPWEYSVGVAARAAAGLHAAHELIGTDGKPLDVVHRDVSPQNILLSYSGHVKVVDFGIAYAEEKLGHTAAGTLKGKAAYMSPEQASGDPLDRRSDIFSLGIVLFESVCMRRLFRKDTQTGTLMKVRQAKVPPPSRIVKGIPPELERIILKALAKEPADRYATMREMAEDLEELLVAHRKAVTSTKLSSLVEDLFHDRKKHKDIQIAQAMESRSPKVMKSVGADWNTGTSIELSSATNPKGVGSEATPVETASRVTTEKKRSRTGLWLGGLGVVLLVVAVVIGYPKLQEWRGSSNEGGSGGPLGPSRNGKKTEGGGQGGRDGSRETGDKGANKATVPDAGAAARVQTPQDAAVKKEEKKQVRLRVEVIPKLSRVRIKFAGKWHKGPVFEAVLPRSRKPKDLIIRARGYHSKILVVVPNEDTRLRLELDKLPRRTRTPRPPRDRPKQRGGDEDEVLRDFPE